jgi:hypothetical protein
MQVMGSCVAGEAAEQWREAFDELKAAGELKADGTNLFKQLRISYNGLTGTQKHMFVDVACSMLGWPAAAAKAIWRG